MMGTKSTLKDMYAVADSIVGSWQAGAGYKAFDPQVLLATATRFIPDLKNSAIAQITEWAQSLPKLNPTLLKIPPPELPAVLDELKIQMTVGATGCTIIWIIHMLSAPKHEAQWPVDPRTWQSWPLSPVIALLEQSIRTRGGKNPQIANAIETIATSMELVNDPASRANPPAGIRALKERLWA